MFLKQGVHNSPSQQAVYIYLFEHRMNVVHLRKETELLPTSDELLHSDKD